MTRLWFEVLLDLVLAEALYVLKLTTWVRLHVAMGSREVN